MTRGVVVRAAARSVEATVQGADCTWCGLQGRGLQGAVCTGRGLQGRGLQGAGCTGRGLYRARAARARAAGRGLYRARAARARALTARRRWWRGRVRRQRERHSEQRTDAGGRQQVRARQRGWSGLRTGGSFTSVAHTEQLCSCRRRSVAAGRAAADAAHAHTDTSPSWGAQCASRASARTSTSLAPSGCSWGCDLRAQGILALSAQSCGRIIIFSNLLEKC